MKARGTYEINNGNTGRYYVRIDEISIPEGTTLDDALVVRLNDRLHSVAILNGQFVLENPTVLLFYPDDASHWPACVSRLQTLLAEFFQLQPIHYVNQFGTSYELDCQGNIRREED